MDNKIVGLAFCIAASAMSMAAQTVTGSGTTNTVPVFTGASVVGNSPVTVNGGNVGIGLTSASPYPMGVLDIRSSLNEHVVILANDSLSASTFSGPGILSTSDSDDGPIFEPLGFYASSYYFGGGDVGIGVISQPTTPLLAPLQIAATGAGPTAAVFGSGGNGISIIANYPIVGFNTYLTNSGPLSLATGYGGYIELNESDGSMDFKNAPTVTGTGTPQTFTEQMRITSAGNVGIGTTSPSGMLSVGPSSQFQVSSAGAVSTPSITFTGANGGTQTMPWTGVLCGGDYAEAVNAKGSRKAYEPGDVLVIGDGDQGEVEKSAEPYSTMVAGIFATKPGVIGRRQSLLKESEEIPMAMVGIVPTKVTTENGPIHRGDLLVTSSTTGYAMKGTDRSRLVGAVIGKAMGPLENGTGVIEVLVTLQ
jgi:hypothetical protein